MATKKSTTKKSAAKKSTAKRSAAKRTTTSRSPAGKATAKESPARKATAKRSPSRESRPGSSAPRAEAGKKRTGLQIAQEAARQLLELTGREAEGVVAMERTDDGWRIEVEVVEVRRIPDTTDVLALYEVTVDGDGDLEGYRRLRRYGRGVPGEERDR